MELAINLLSIYFTINSYNSDYSIADSPLRKQTPFKLTNGLLSENTMNLSPLVNKTVTRYLNGIR